MGANQKKSQGIYQTKPGRFLLQARFMGKRKTRRIRGGVPDAKANYAQMLLELQAEHRMEEQNTGEPSASGLLAPSGSCRSPTPPEWVPGRYNGWRKASQKASTLR